MKWALYGCGVIAEHHANAIRQVNGDLTAEVTACIDLKPERAAHLAELTGGKAFASYDDALSTADFDAVLLALPHHLHVELALQVLRSDKHLLLEKPMAPTPDGCATILAEAEATAARVRAVTPGRQHVFSVAENSSFWPEVAAAVKLIKDGAIGELVTGKAHYYECMANRIMDKDDEGKDAKKDGCGWLDWRANLATAGGGVVMDGGQHWIRPLREIFGEVEAVVGVTGHPWAEIEGESMSHAILRFESGKTASYQATVIGDSGWLSNSKDPFFRLIGEKGEIVIEGQFEGGALLFTQDEPNGVSIVGDARGFVSSYTPQMQDFCAAWASGQGTAALMRPPAFAVGDLATALAIYKSARTGKWENVGAPTSESK